MKWVPIHLYSVGTHILHAKTRIYNQTQNRTPNLKERSKNNEFGIFDNQITLNINKSVGLGALKMSSLGDTSEQEILIPSFKDNSQLNSRPHSPA